MSLVDEEAITINSKAYWDTRFRTHHWQDNQGEQQTLFFGQMALDNLPDWLAAYIRFNKLSICDFGCALGQITKLLADTFPDSYVIGQDISTMAINQAKKLFPELNFTHRDLLQSTQERYDIIFSSNVLEHFHDPHRIINTLASKTNRFLVFLIPFYDNLDITEHFYSFSYKNIPRVVNDQFYLIFYKEIDGSIFSQSYYNGLQILLIYAVDSVINELEHGKHFFYLLKNKFPINTYRYAFIDFILNIERKNKIETEKMFAVKQAEYEVIQQQLIQAQTQISELIDKKTQRFHHYIHSFLFKKRMNALYFILKKYKACLRGDFSYILYRMYLKSPLPLKRLAFKCYHQIIKIKKNKEPILNSDVIIFINNIRRIFDIRNAIFYVQSTVMNFEGNNFYSGGAERYVLDLNLLILNMKFNFICIQKSTNKPWIRYYYGLTIIGLPAFENPILFEYYTSLLVQGSKAVLSSPFSIFQRKIGKINIGISHGIYWDHESINHTAAQIASQAKNFDRFVSVDTATINFVRSHHIDCASKIDYIPNYVDHDFFKPILNRHASTVRILYPRRLYLARGFWVVCKILPIILNEFDYVSFIFCGKGGERELKKIRNLEIKYGDRVKYLTLQPEQMHVIYQQVDIVLIPTIYSEGTSLSLIEAMASRKAIIGTCVGGITDLITDRFTGLLIKPDDEKQLIHALKELICDKNLRDYLAENAYKKSFCFSIKIWQNKWRKLIEETIEPIENTSNNKIYNFSFLHLPTLGVSFDKMKQRPQQLFLALSKSVKCFFIEDKNEFIENILGENLIISGDRIPIDTSGLVCYIHFAYNYDAIKDKKVHRLIYDVLDHPSIHNSQKYLDYHYNLLEIADIILTSSQILFEKYTQFYEGKIVRYIPNAANPDDFVKVHYDSIPADFPSYAQNRTIGFYGALAEWVDYDLIDKIAVQFSDAQIVLIGPCRQNFPERKNLDVLLNKHRNIFYLGEKKYEELFNYARLFSISIIPFIINEVTLNCSPVKLFEYMNIGAPIVTTNMPECKKYNSVFVADNHSSFLHFLSTAFDLPKKDNYFKLMRKEAEENTWRARAKLVIEAVSESFDVRG